MNRRSFRRGWRTFIRIKSYASWKVKNFFSIHLIYTYLYYYRSIDTFCKLKFEGKVAARPDVEEGEGVPPDRHIWTRQAALLANSTDWRLKS